MKLTVLRILLIPFSMFYSVLIFVRNKFYDHEIFRSYTVSKPVISIGNITTGGTGKTPLTIFLAEYFLSKRKKVGIVSRGYKRKSKDVVIVCDGITVNENVSESGDELILISNQLLKNYRGKIFTVANSDRVTASKLLITKFDPDIIILDDAFQHRRIRRDLDIVIMDSSDLQNKSFLDHLTIPSGNLREGRSNLKRAGIIVQNNKERHYSESQKLLNTGAGVLLMRYKTEYFIDNKNSILQNVNRSVIVFSGIANDGSFIEMVKQSGFKIVKAVKFPDHHYYSETDLES